MNNQRDQIAQILADNITYSPQIQGIVIHGVVEKLAEREEDARTRGYKRAMLHALALDAAVIVIALIAYMLPDAQMPPTYLPPVPRIVIDTSIVTLGSMNKVVDSMVISHRQASPQTQHLYDSERVERRSEK